MSRHRRHFRRIPPPPESLCDTREETLNPAPVDPAPDLGDERTPTNPDSQPQASSLADEAQPNTTPKSTHTPEQTTPHEDTEPAYPDFAVEILGTTSILQAQLQELSETIATRDDVTENLQSTVQQLRKDQIAALLSPGVKKLINLLNQVEDSVNKDYKDLPAQQIADKQQEELEYFAETLEDVLFQLGFARIPVDEFAAFSPRLHKALQTIDTADATHDKTIATELRPGFFYKGAAKATFPASVSVYKYNPSLTPETPPTQSQPHTTPDTPTEPSSTPPEAPTQGPTQQPQRADHDTN